MAEQVCSVYCYLGIFQYTQTAFVRVAIAVTCANRDDCILRCRFSKPSIFCRRTGSMMANFEHITGNVVSRIQNCCFFCKLCVTGKQETGVAIYYPDNNRIVVGFFRINRDGADNLTDCTSQEESGSRCRLFRCKRLIRGGLQEGFFGDCSVAVLGLP